MEQAKKLKDILGEMFGREIVKEVIHGDRYYRDWYYYPYIPKYGHSDFIWTENVVYSGKNTLELTC